MISSLDTINVPNTLAEFHFHRSDMTLYPVTHPVFVARFLVITAIQEGKQTNLE